jgi:regulator of replication initiation timing
LIHTSDTSSVEHGSSTLLEEHSALRKELRDELDYLKEEIASLRKEVDEWREKYYHQVETTNGLSFEVNVLKSRLREYETITDEFGIRKDKNDD